jgi:alanine dehydrogenase
MEIGQLGMKEALKTIPSLNRGVNTLEGKLVHTGVADAMIQDFTDEG